MKKIILFCLIIVTFIQCNVPTTRGFVKSNFKYVKELTQIRVLLEKTPRIEDLRFDCKVLLRSNQNNFAEIKAGESIRIYYQNASVEIRTKTKKYLLETFDIYPVSENELLSYKQKSYRGIFRIKPEGSNLLLINTLKVEDYLQAVIYPEMGPASKPADFEALKAFAVCLRNYTYMKIRESKGQFDVYPDSRDQNYHGVSGEKAFTSKAISETNNLVLEYNGQLAKTFYYSSCGGHTENCDNVFSEKRIEYLSGIRDGEDSYCRISPGFNWVEIYNASELVNMLMKAKYIDGLDYEVRKVEIKSRFRSGRVNEMRITVSNSEGELKDLFLIGNTIRNVIRSKSTKGLLKSIMFEIEPEYKNNCLKTLKISGKGNGHGVGFCQWGAIAQARAGKRFDDLLYFYFPGTNLSEI